MIHRNLVSQRLAVTALALTAIALVLSGLASAQHAGDSTWHGDNADLPPELAQVLRGYETAWTAKDAKALANLFAENGFVLASGSPPMRGRADIEKHYAGAGGPLHLRALYWAREGNVGYIIGEYAPDPDFANRGKFTLTLTRHESGRWLIMSDMDNGNTRPRPAQQPSP